MYDYSDAYIVVRETIDLLAAAANENDNAEKDVVFKNNAPFRSCMSKISCTLIDTAKNLDIAMPMNILLEYSHNFPKISGRLWNYYRDEINNVNDTKIVGKTLEIPSSQEMIEILTERHNLEPILNVEVTVPLKYLSNFWRSLDISLINCEEELDLLWRKDSVLIELHNNIRGKNFMITSSKGYVPVVTFFKQH